MSSICFYFQVHQPYRLKPYSFFKIGHDHAYEATALNVEIINRVSDVCYLPANALMQRLIEQHKGRFKVSYAITGTALEQLSRHRPDVIESFRKLGETGCVEFLGETYYHSLAALYSPTEFERQVALHQKAVTHLLGQKPVTFRNTELLYQNGLAAKVHDLGYSLILAEGAPRNIGREAPNQVFRSMDGSLKVLARNFALSDDIAFRFSDPSWSEYPLSAQTFSKWLHATEGSESVVNLFMDYETFGEHRKADTGIFRFIEALPPYVLANPQFSFKTPAELAKTNASLKNFDSPAWSSWADADKDASAWTEDHMQRDALRKLYECEPRVLALGRPEILDVWSKLQTSDHFYYMSTRYRNDPTHQAFSHYLSPYDAYLNFMNVLSDFTKMIGRDA